MAITRAGSGSHDATMGTQWAYGRSVAKRKVAERSPPTMLDVLDRVLDKGVVIDFDMDISVAGLSALRWRGKVIVASIERYRSYAVQQQQAMHDVSGDVDLYLGRLRGAQDGRPAWP